MQLELKLYQEVVVVVGVEEWRLVSQFPSYEVSSHGRFRRIKTGRILAGSTKDNGYLDIGFDKNGKHYTKLAHRIVALAFLEPGTVDSIYVNHKNKDRQDNRVSNLEWTTASANAKHSKR